MVGRKAVGPWFYDGCKCEDRLSIPFFFRAMNASSASGLGRPFSPPVFCCLDTARHHSGFPLKAHPASSVFQFCCPRRLRCHHSSWAAHLGLFWVGLQPSASLALRKGSHCRGGGGGGLKVSLAGPGFQPPCLHPLPSFLRSLPTI